VSAIPTIPAATKVYSAVRDQNVKPPNINELSEYVNRVLALRGLRANQDKIKDLADEDSISLSGSDRDNVPRG
jgi:hypothetical protein